jgi:hypothetical protein
VANTKIVQLIASFTSKELAKVAELEDLKLKLKLEAIPSRK